MSDAVNQQHALACRTALQGAAEATSRVLLVGEVNPISSRPEHALFCAPAGCSGHRLQELIFGLPRVHYLALWRTNLCRGDWSKASARFRVDELTDERCPWDVIVMLGRQVAGAFAPLVGMSAAAKPHDIAGFVTGGRRIALVSIPHPSGLNRVWNAPGEIPRVRALMTRVAPDIPWGTA